MSSNNLKLLVLALDGFDPDLFVGWREELPNLSALADSGYFSRINSSVPPMTFPAWSTFLTGINPGKHGIFDFTERIPGKLGVRFINATRRKFPNFLAIASERRLRVGSVGLPTTYPPEPLSCFQISGFDTPLPSKANTSHIYPVELAKKIEDELGGYYFGDFNEGKITPGWHRRVLDKLFKGLERKRDLVRLLVKEFSLELLVLHVGETDTVGHHFWSFHDNNSPRFKATGEEGLSRAILEVYRRTDTLVGEVLEFTNPENVLVVSDHGMGGTSDRMLYLNNFLAENGLLQFTSGNIISSSMGTLKRVGMKWTPYRWQQLLFHFGGGRIASNIESLQRFSGIDWSKTIAYSEELNYFPATWINLKGREPFGIVAVEDRDKVVERIKSALLQWRDSVDGTSVIRDVFRREELYDGDEVDHAPDIILELNRPDGYSYALGKSSSVSRFTSVRQMAPEEYIGYKGGSMNGSHRQMGTFIIRTGSKLQHVLGDISLEDIAPTVLHLLGLKSPDWMEGHSLIGVERRIDQTDVKTQDEYIYGPIEEQAINERLRKLGYLD